MTLLSFIILEIRVVIMITKLTIRNFKKFDFAEIELTPPVVFIGPNNSGKTTALQALSLWETGYRKWVEKRGFDKEKQPKERAGITINRRDLTAIPISVTKNIWKNLHTHQFNKDKRNNEKIYIDIIVEGYNELENKQWECGFEFYYANEESFYCRPLRLSNDKKSQRMPVPEINDLNIAFLPPMSGLVEQEFHKQPGEIEFLIGQGQTAEVLRNLCYKVYTSFPHNWEYIVEHLSKVFGIKILSPDYTERNEIRIFYEEPTGVKLNLSSSGRGVQQVLLLLVYLYANPNSILLLDEPDAHLEILRQRQIYNLILKIADETNSQIIAASHSEIVLNEAAKRGTVVAFTGNPHVMNKKAQLIKSLTAIGFEQYYQAEQKGWVLYLEGATDLAILKEFALKLNHSAKELLDDAFVHYVENNLPQEARNHFYALQEAISDLTGIAIFDKLDKELHQGDALIETQWHKKEIENYLFIKDIFYSYILEGIDKLGLFAESERKKRIKAMDTAFEEVHKALKTFGKDNLLPDELKVSDEFIEPLFRIYSEKMGIPLTLRKSDFYKLIKYIPVNQIDPEIKEKLDLIYQVSQKAKVVN